jgi:sugar lactone lactonase YvrE
MDQGDNRVYLVDYKDGKVLRAFDTEADRASGITFDGETLWLASTYSREIIRCDAMTGKTISKQFTPGAGVIYQMVGDPPGRSSPLATRSNTTQGQRQGQNQAGSGEGSGRVQQTAARNLGTGAHGMEWKDGKLWVAVPPSRTIYRLDPKTWIVELKFPTAGNRPHGIGWEEKWLWCTDSNLNAFFKHDPVSGEIVEKIQLADSDPLPHGMTIWEGVMWYCDDVGVVCNLKL